MNTSVKTLIQATIIVGMAYTLHTIKTADKPPVGLDAKWVEVHSEDGYTFSLYTDSNLSESSKLIPTQDTVRFLMKEVHPDGYILVFDTLATCSGAIQRYQFDRSYHYNKTGDKFKVTEYNDVTWDDADNNPIVKKMINSVCEGIK